VPTVQFVNRGPAHEVHNSHDVSTTLN
jgi:hypothetical protein